MEMKGTTIFPVDEDEKRRLSWRAIPATLRGKVGIVVVVLFLVVGIATLPIGLSMPGLDLSSTGEADFMKLLAISLSAASIVLSPCYLGRLYRTQNTRCAMRTNERMQLVEGHVLVYEYVEHRGWDQMKLVRRGGVPRFTMVPRRVAVVDLDAVRVSRIGRLGEWELSGPVRMRLEEDGGEETRADGLVVGPYFGKDFEGLMASRAARR